MIVVIFVCQHRPEDPPGTNILGVLPGSRWGTAGDRLVVVGAHWDTVLNTGGLDDNGSGVSAMLELGKRNLSVNTSHIFRVSILSKFPETSFSFREGSEPWQVRPGVLGDDGGFRPGGGGQSGQSRLHPGFPSTDSPQTNRGWDPRWALSHHCVTRPSMVITTVVWRCHHPGLDTSL